MFTFGVGRMTVRLFPIVKTGWGEKSGDDECSKDANILTVETYKRHCLLILNGGDY
jgi:hypothetical protein